MDKKNLSNIILIIVCFVLIGVIVILYDKAFLDNEMIIESKEEVKISDKTIAIMYETGVESGEYVASDETTWPSEGYTFNETLSKCENNSSISYDGTNVKVLANKSDRCYVYFDREVITLANYIKRLYTMDGDNNIYLHDGSGDYGDLEAGDNSYRYAGASEEVNNYICLGSNEATCPEENTFRIIGVFNDQIKVIRNTSIGKYYWSGSAENTSNEWAASTLNTEVLNGTYLNSLSFSNLIEVPTNGWQVGGNIVSNIVQSNAKNVYINEIVSPATSILDNNSKIGMLYLSDYMYSANPIYWNKLGYDENNEENDYRATLGNNWILYGGIEWSITRVSNITYGAIGIHRVGNTSARSVDTYDDYVRPSFYITSIAIYIKGTGEVDNPYIISE